MKSLIVLSLLVASPALAQCPVAQDLATGIRVTESDGTTSLYRAHGPGIVRQNVTYSDGYEFQNLLAQGSHILQLAEVENGVLIPDSVSITAYPSAAFDLPAPTPSSRWDVETAVRSFGSIYTETQSQIWGATVALTIGNCPFDAVPGKVTYQSDDMTITEGLYYLPALGISLLNSYEDSETVRETYTFTAIEAAQ